MQDKDKKITELRTLLSTAKNKIDEHKLTISSKDKQIGELKASYQKKIKDLQTQSSQIIKQYEERLLRYQKSLEDSENLVAKYQAQAIANSKSNEETSQAMTQIGNATMRIFTLNKVKDNSEAVEQLCNIEKCKQFLQELDRVEKNEDIAPVFKSLTKLTDLLAQALSKKREARLIAMKKQAQLKKSLEEEQEKSVVGLQKIAELQTQMKKSEADWRSKVDEISKSKMKMSEQLANLQFIKQLLIKVFVGPKEASLMALEVLGKVLKMDQDELRTCTKKIK